MSVIVVLVEPIRMKRLEAYELRGPCVGVYLRGYVCGVDACTGYSAAFADRG